jgi:hypothetical protein
VLAELRDMCAKQRYALNAVPYFDVYAGREKAALGDLEGAVQQLRTITDEVFKTRHLGNVDVAAEALVETLLERGCDSDLAEAEAAIDRMENRPVDFVGRHAISRCCFCVPCCRRAVVRKPPIRTWRSAIARWRCHSAPRGKCSGPQRCRDRSLRQSAARILGTPGPRW